MKKVCYIGNFIQISVSAEISIFMKFKIGFKNKVNLSFNVDLMLSISKRNRSMCNRPIDAASMQERRQMQEPPVRQVRMRVCARLRRHALRA